MSLEEGESIKELAERFEVSPHTSFETFLCLFDYHHRFSRQNGGGSLSDNMTDQATVIAAFKKAVRTFYKKLALFNSTILVPSVVTKSS